MKLKNENNPRKRKAKTLEPSQVLIKQPSLEEDGIVEIGQEEFYKGQPPKKQKTSPVNHFAALLSSPNFQDMLNLLFSQAETISLTPLADEEEKAKLPQTIQARQPQPAKAPIFIIDDEGQPDEMLPPIMGPIALPTLQTSNDRDKEKGKEREVGDYDFPTIIAPQNRPPFFYLDDNNSIQELENSINLSANGVRVKFQYLSSKKDKPGLVYIAPLNIISSQQTHYGVYAKCFIKKGTVLFEYTGEKVSDEENEDEKRDSDYFMLLMHPPKKIDAKYLGNGSRFINDSTAKENVQFRERKGKMLVIAVTDIFEDEQLLVSYGPDYRFGFKPFFLHPSDNFRSAQEIFAANKDYYHPVPYHFANCSYDLSALGISREDTAFIPKPIYQMLHNKSIKKYDAFSHLPLPVLKVKDGQFTPLWQQERITLVLMAAYLGKVAVLKKLLQNPKTDANIQQAMSGRTALHLACLGTSLDRNPHDVKKRLGLIDLLVKTSSLDFKDGNNKAPIFTLIDHASSTYLKHFMQKVEPTLEDFKGHKRNRFDPFFYALKNNKKTHALVILQYMEKIGELSNYAEYIKEFVRKKIIFTNGRSDLNLIANCNEVLAQMGIAKTVVKIPNLFMPQVSISKEKNRVFRPDLPSNLLTKGN
ncbi:eukaryotic huntingtin interacting protein B [Legionella nautarum]|uniref:Eukaryotic huntingtin interacting protein B n=1 Tax=Legionella nautarum TaxID=45070 RepID=A0A0W0WL01_9GAMM|nr:SET domain-containing protein-lysine N-methyltransferase [Legionella nautarum]KTD33013.1 eukaryotic huntingtin interacting protein B [Legionella nautarum]